MNRRHLVLAGPALWAGTWLGGSARAQAPTGMVRFGQSASITGEGGEHGKAVRAGILAAFDAANKSDGTRAPRFELVTLDDAGSPERCASNIKALADAGMTGLLGLTSGAGAEAALPVLEAQQIALLGTASGHMGIRAGHTSAAYHTRAGYDLEFSRMVSYVKDRSLSRVGVVYLEGTAKPNLAAMTVALAAAGMTPAVAIALDRAQPSYDAVAAKLVDNKLDAVLFMAGAASTAAIVDHLTAARYRGMVFASSMGGQELVDALAAKGQSAVMSVVVPRPNALGLAVVGRCQQDLTALGADMRMGVSVLEGYIAGRIAVEASHAAGRAGAVNRARLKETLATLRADLGGYKVQFTPGNPHGSKYVELVTIDRYGKMVG
jgi:branched-chain amino acid transport system substrate-binding protein